MADTSDRIIIMNTLQKQSLYRQLIMTIASLVTSYGLMEISGIALLVPLVTGIVLWLVSPTQNTASALRKLIQMVPPVLIYYNLANEAQAAAWSGVLLTITLVWTMEAKTPLTINPNKK